MRLPFEVFRESIGHMRPKQPRAQADSSGLGRQRPWAKSMEGQKTKKEPRLLLTAMTLLERYAGNTVWSG